MSVAHTAATTPAIAEVINPESDAEIIQRVHQTLSAVASPLGVKSSRLINNTTSRHELPTSTSFTQLAALHCAVLDHKQDIQLHDFVASSSRELVFSARFRLAVATPAAAAASAAVSGSSTTTSSKKSRKRQRDVQDDQEDAVVEAIRRLAKARPENVPMAELDTAQSILLDLVTHMRGPAQEFLVQSFAVLLRKLQPSDERARVIIAMRFNAGIAISLSQLKRCLGACWRDGVLTTAPSIRGVCDRDLPLTEEGIAALELGNAPLLMVTSVPIATL